MLPTLPASDPNPSQRDKSLQADRQRYQFDRSIGGMPLAKEVPKGEGYSAEYILRAAKVNLMLLDNRAKASADPAIAADRERYAKAVEEASNGVFDRLSKALESVKKRGLFAAPLTHASSMEEFRALHSHLPDALSSDLADDDRFFAWQRLAGCNPAYVRALKETDARLSLTDAHVAAAGGEGETLERAMSEGRLLLLDHSNLEGLPTSPSYGFERYVAGALAVFLRTLGGPVVPVAVQLGPTPDAQLVTPEEGLVWRHAKLVAQSADSANQGLTEHLGMCHVFANGVLLCTARELAPQHPLRILLWPHFEMTLAANETMKTAVIGEGGFVDVLQGPSLQAGIELAAKGQRSRSVRDSALPRDLALRGVDDSTALPEYPYRDDGLLIWGAIESWAEEYLRLYYADAAAVAGDTELASWLAALASDDGGSLYDLPTVETVSGLAELVTIIVYRISAYHAVINYGGWDYWAHSPNMPTARFGPPPEAGEEVTEETIRKVLPPLGLAEYVLNLMLPQRELRLNLLGEYGRWFEDPRVAPVLGRFQARLAAIETEIGQRNEKRRWSYPYLLPSRIAQSIHV